MNLRTTLLFLYLFCISALSQNKERDSCQLFFKEIGIKDFTLGSNYQQFLFNSKKIHRKFKEESVYGIEIITFSESIILFKLKKNIAYNLKFKNDILMAYDFEIYVGDFRKAPDFYNKVLKLLEKNKNKNSFIQGKSHSNMRTDNHCVKDFGLSTEKNGSYIYGGISYQSPIWEQQFRDYLKATKP